MWSAIVKGLVDAIVANPDVLKELVQEGLTAGLNALKAHNAKTAAAATAK